LDVTTSNQPYVFVFSILCGVTVAFLFDVFRILRRVINSSDRAVLFQDIIFWIITAFLFFFFVLVTNSGEVRLFEFVAVVLGAVLYFFTLGRIVLPASVKIIEFLLKIIHHTLKIIFTPVVWILRLLKKPYFIVLGGGKRTARKIKYGFLKKWELCKKFVTKI